MRRSNIKKRAERMRKRIPGTMTITLTPVLANNVTGTATSVDYAEKRPLELTTQTALGIELDVQTCEWCLWAVELDGVTPKRGWLITDPDGVQWKVVSTSLTLLETRWKLPCTKMITST